MSKDRRKWILLSEWWYSATFHSSIKMTPSKVVYKYNQPPQLALYCRRNQSRGCGWVIAENRSYDSDVEVLSLVPTLIDLK